MWPLGIRCILLSTARAPLPAAVSTAKTGRKMFSLTELEKLSNLSHPSHTTLSKGTTGKSLMLAKEFPRRAALGAIGGGALEDLP